MTKAIAGLVTAAGQGKTTPLFIRLLLAVLMLIAIYMLFVLIEWRDNLSQLEKQKNEMQDVVNDLRDNQRALELEYLTATRYESLVTRANLLQMVEPKVEDGNLIYLKVVEK